ncbi:alpha/beta fold hydrolase [Aliiglaciecola sp. CAU 1673]|uniref:alpha/beta fold hydrolase n=1 Tax=Aliiglaciecola sp. CAU 1673 TaxID=3032595 RepID=UPI0023DA1285|nr:alpha/beta fold hydrolase [Aliiglaciecola sp. CAU 1673]MDF2180021.1 alpha/beta fold hydrolase [Aliiglaciecola sp. CAU 1673]
MTDLHYQLAGEGKPVVLLHGLFGNLENLNSIKRALQDQYQVVSLDLPDHGRSAHSNTFSYDDYARQVLGTLDHLGLEDIALLGHSMGGKVAMRMAQLAPERFDKLMIADIAPVAYGHRHQNVFNGLSAVDLATLSDRKEADVRMASHIQEPGVRQFLLKSLYQDEGGWQWRFNLPLLAAEYPDIIDWQASEKPYSGPTLFIKGGQSDYIQADHRPAILQQFPNSQGKILQGAGHWLHAEKPTAFNKIVQDFLADEAN